MHAQTNSAPADPSGAAPNPQPQRNGSDSPLGTSTDAPRGPGPAQQSDTGGRDLAGRALAELAQLLGSPPRTYAIHGEGNVSLKLDQTTFLIKASGMPLGGIGERSLVHCDLQRVLALVHSGLPDDAQIGLALAETRADQRPALRPSLETGLHAVLLAAGAVCVAHTHPEPITGLLCSRQARALTAGALFPDQVVVCGAHPLFLPYTDPGLPMARALDEAVRAHLRAHGHLPKAIYLQNHGFVAVGRGAGEALAITDMAVKAAKVLAIALAAGGPRYLSEEEVRHITSRSDEHYRQRALGLTEEGASA